MPHENLLRHFPAGIDFIKQAIKSGGNVLVHWYSLRFYYVASQAFREAPQSWSLTWFKSTTCRCSMRCRTSGREDRSSSRTRAFKDNCSTSKGSSNRRRSSSKNRMLSNKTSSYSKCNSNRQTNKQCPRKRAILRTILMATNQSTRLWVQIKSKITKNIKSFLSSKRSIKTVRRIKKKYKMLIDHRLLKINLENKFKINKQLAIIKCLDKIKGLLILLSRTEQDHLTVRIKTK